jgi:calcineurin-like phosphoesterase family protein
MPNLFFTSDEHFGHNNIISKFQFRPFADLDEMTEGLIANHNARVGKGDLVFHNGDMFWRTFPIAKAHEVMDRLNGQHYYIRGNHEELMDKHQSLRERFIWTKDLATIHPPCPPGTPKHPGIVLCHYAMRVWNRSHTGRYHLYGHSHGELPENDSLSFDVGVDCNNYAPVSLDEVNERMEEKIERLRRISDELPPTDDSD